MSKFSAPSRPVNAAITSVALFLTAYQIAISFAEHHPRAFRSIGKPIGGKGAGPSQSLAQYLAGQLSRRIKSGSVTDIEGADLNEMHDQTITYESAHGKIVSSKDSSNLSMFRLRCD